MKIEDFLNQILILLDQGRKDNEFSYWVEHELARRLPTFREENEAVAMEMNDVLPDICEQMEPGMESDDFHRELRAEVIRLIGLLN